LNLVVKLKYIDQYNFTINTHSINYGEYIPEQINPTFRPMEINNKKEMERLIYKSANWITVCNGCLSILAVSNIYYYLITFVYGQLKIALVAYNALGIVLSIC